MSDLTHFDDAIRQVERNAELVRKYHPDQSAALGIIAAQAGLLREARALAARSQEDHR